MSTPVRTKLITLIVLSASLAGCEHPQTPEPQGETVITLGEAEHLTVLDVESGRVIARPGPISRFSSIWGASPDNQTLYVFDTKPPGPDSAALMGLDTRSLRIVWREPWRALLTMPWTGAARTLEGTEILIRGEREGVRGIIALDSRTREKVGFFGPVTAGARAVRVPPRTDTPVGLVLVGGTRTVNVIPSVGSLFVLDGATLQLRDSTVLVPSSPTRFGGIRHILPSPDGRYAYVETDSRIFRYDIAARSVVGSVALPSLGRMAISPDGRRLYRTDSGDGRNYSGSGFLYVFDAELRPLPPVDLRSVLPVGQHIQTNDAVVNRDGTRVYVAAGSASRGPLYATQPGRVLVIDAVAGRLLEDLPTGDWYTRYIFLR